MRIHPGIIYASLCWTCLLYMVPVGYFAILLRYRKWIDGFSKVWDLSFLKTDLSVHILQAVVLVWAGISVGLIIYRAVEYHRWSYKLRDSISISGGKEFWIFQKVCRVMGVSSAKIGLEMNVWLESPVVCGLGHPRVVLPDRVYSSEELLMIYYHELSHYIHRDLWIKQLTIAVSIFHSLNLPAHYLLKNVDLYSECMADVLALEKSGCIHCAKPYYDKILDLIVVDNNANREHFVFSAWFERKDTLQRRIHFMKMYQKMKFSGKALTAALTAAFMIASTSTAFAAGSSVADLHSDLYKYSEELADDNAVVADDGMIEHSCNIEDLDMEGMEIIYEDELVFHPDAMFGPIHERWQCKPDTRHVSASFKILKNYGIISVSCTVLPNNKKYMLGVMDYSGHAKYVDGVGACGHNFKDMPREKYRVFIQRNDKEEEWWTAEVGYGYYYPD